MSEDKKYARDHCTLSLMGRLVADPREPRSVGDGSVTTIRIAANTSSKDSIFIDVDCWNGRGDYVSKYARKGGRVLVSGKIVPNKYKTDAREVDTFKIVSDSVTVIDHATDEEKEEVTAEVTREARVTTPATATATAEKKIAPPPPQFPGDGNEDSTGHDEIIDPDEAVIITADEDDDIIDPNEEEIPF